MQYEGDIYRPPSEAYSLIIQATVGCARNSCTFCSMYKRKKFRVRDVEEVLAELQEVAAHHGASVRRVFLADGNALVLPTASLIRLILEIWRLFPNCERISSYGAPADILEKTPDELREIREAGLSLVYMGLESGDDEVLRQVKKGATAREIIEAGQKIRAAGAGLSLTIISGLGGKPRLQEHAVASARAMNQINPEYASLLTLMVEPDAPIYQQVRRGEFELLSPDEVMEELLLFLSHTDSEGTVFRSNHASNYLALAGTFNADRERLIREVEEARASLRFRPEQFRRL